MNPHSSAATCWTYHAGLLVDPTSRVRPPSGVQRPSTRGTRDRWVSHAPLTEAEREYWTRDGAPTPGPLDRQLMAGLPPALGSDEGWAMAWPFDDGTWLIVGYMPPDAGEGSEARVVLRKPLATADGGSTRTLDLPTFDAGAADGRPMFAATISPELGVPTPTEGDDAVYLLERIPVVVVPPSNG